jgi:CheY-like chemotaxis protein/Tfp pilus assembly protein PilZ
VQNEGGRMKKTKILLVDDAKIFLDIQKDFLRFSPAEVFTAYNGIEALIIAKQERPDMIVMNGNLPQKEGLSCCKAIKSDPDLYSTPVILVSTKSGQDDMESYNSAGCNAVLYKPLQRREFLNKIYVFLPAIERREPRVPCRMPVTVEAGSAIFVGMSHDIAMNGLYVATDHNVESVSEILLSFSLPMYEDKVTVTRGRIAWRNNIEEDTKNDLPRGFGVEFLEITGENGVIARFNDLTEFVAARSTI